MNKVKLLWGKHPLVTALSLGFMVLGIGCISWSMFGIFGQSNYFVDTSNSYKAPTTIDSKAKAVVGGGTSKVELDQSLDKNMQIKTLYPVYPVDGDNIGSLTIPALNRKLTIIQGTSVDNLREGVGHFTQSVLPGEADNCVLSGHRDTVFRKVGSLKIGDLLILKTSAGTFTYEISGTRIVHKDDKTVIVPTDNAILTMTTCYPFNFIGNAPDRYIISATLIKNK
ncbi:class D sortase [Clostridium lacusfryxellense]|uniref:class D sortase n=1 Tax=Clostridium lacusfryxellense TaxID=205328 RepID=UPI001C0E04A4|nr:class D sortase [Clostridium lacusfryxellense]MBU3113781.1 class D sortase [Clostridium lacusfryxellense]